MVEKVSESIAKSIAEIDVSSDKNDFLDLINKKKKDKKPADPHDIAAVFFGHIPQLLNKNAAHGGGTKTTDTQVAANHGQSLNHLLLEETSDKALRNKILAIAGQHIAGNKPTHDSARTKDSVAINGVAAKSDDKAIAAALAGVTAQAAGSTANKEGMPESLPAGIESIRSLFSRQSGADATAPQNSLADADSTALQNSLADAALLHRVQAPAMQFSEAAFSGTPRNETAARGEKAPVQAGTAQAVGSEATEKQSMDLNYQFQRWSGDHSVKVSIPTNTRGDSNITMQPSDARAADALSRHLSQMPGQKAELLQPKTGAVLAENKRDGNIALAITDPRAIDGSSRLTTQSPEPATELYHAQHDSEERERQRQRDTQEEEQE